MPRVIFVMFSVGLEHHGRIEIRIEREREKMPVGRSIVCGKKLLRCFLKITSETWTILRDGTAAEEKRYREGLAMKIVEADRLTEFVGEFAVQEFRAGNSTRGIGLCRYFVFRSDRRE